MSLYKISLTLLVIVMKLFQHKHFDCDVGLVEEHIPDQAFKFLELVVQDVVDVKAEEHKVWMWNRVLLTKLD